MCRGSIREGEKLLLGPSDSGTFDEVKVRTVHRNRLPCRLIQAGQAASVALLDVEREKLRKVRSRNTRYSSCLQNFLAEFEDVPLVGFMYLAFTCMPGDSTGNSDRCCCVPCHCVLVSRLSSAINSLC